MKVLRGGSAEVGSNKWVKFDIELDGSDLQRLLIENDLSDVTLTVREAFSLLEAEAETLVTLKMEQLGAKGDVTARDQAQRVTKLISKFQEKYVGGSL